MKKISSIIIGLGMAVGMMAVPAFRGPIQKVQPNGDTITVYLKGDERAHWMETADGQRVMENKKGWICYAVKKWNGKWKAGKERVKTKTKTKTNL